MRLTKVLKTVCMFAVSLLFIAFATYLPIRGALSQSEQQSNSKARVEITFARCQSHEIEKCLQQKAGEGWELVSTSVVMEKNNPNILEDSIKPHHYLYFQRPLRLEE